MPHEGVRRSQKRIKEMHRGPLFRKKDLYQNGLKGEKRMARRGENQTQGGQMKKDPERTAPQINAPKKTICSGDKRRRKKRRKKTTLK